MVTAVSPLLDLLFAQSEGLIELRAKPINDGHGVQKCFIPHGDANQLTKFVGEHLHGYHLFFGVATRRDARSGALTNCLALPTLFCDLDFKHTREAAARRRLSEFPLPPSAVVLSGNGLHVYWMLREPMLLQDPAECALAKSLLRRLARYLGADLVSAEPAHCLRLPGTLNPKYDPPRQALIDHLADEPELQYQPADFDELLPPEPAESAGTTETFTAPESILDGQRNITLYKLTRALKAKGLDGESIRVALHAENRRKCRPPLPDEEVDQIVTHAWTQPDREGFAPHDHAAPSQADVLDLQEVAGRYTVTVAALRVQFIFDRLSQTGGRVSAELTVRVGDTDLLGDTDVNLKSDGSRSNLARTLSGWMADLPWKRLLERACTAVLQRHREGEPIIELTPTDAAHVPFLVNPFVYRDHQTLWYAPGGSCKSYLALFVALLASHGHTQAGVGAVQSPVLYLDWELNAATVGGRLKALQTGHPALSQFMPYYRRCETPLLHEAPIIARQVAERGVQLLIVDSAAMACGGDLNSPDAAIGLQRALRMIGCSSLVLAHTAKNPPEGQDRTAYGTVFFRELARNVWELQRAEADNPMQVLFQQTKNNFGPKAAPLGVQLTFSSGSVSIEGFDPTAEPAFEEKLPVPARIRNLLEDGVLRTAREVAEALDIKLVTAKSALSRGKGIKWMMAAEAGKDAQQWTVLAPK